MNGHKLFITHHVLIVSQAFAYPHKTNEKQHTINEQESARQKDHGPVFKCFIANLTIETVFYPANEV